jgi:hypothetical protein
MQSERELRAAFKERVMVEPQVNHSTEGVDFEFVVDGIPRKAHVSREALEDHCGADEQPESWLAAFRRNEDRISQAARVRLAQGAQEPIFITHLDV